MSTAAALLMKPAAFVSAPPAQNATGSASARASRLSAQVLRTRDEFAAVAAEWNALAERCALTPMSRHEWLTTAAAAFLFRRLAVVLVRDAEGELRAAAPLAVTRFGPFQRLTWLSREMGEPQVLLYDQEAALEILWAAVRALRMPLEARRLTPRGDELAILKRGARHRGLCSIRPGSSRTAAALVTDWAAFEGAMSGNARSEMRRKRKGLEKHGSVRFEAVVPDAADVDAHLDELLRVEASGWKGREGSAIVHRPRLDRFIREYARRTAELGTLRLFFLSLNGEKIAAQMLAQNGGRLWQFKIGYDERWSRYSPGRLLMFDILRWGHDHGLDAVEYLGHGGGWQTRWPAAFTDHASLRFYPPTASALAALIVDSAEFVRRKLSPARAGDPPRKVAPVEQEPSQ